MLNNCGSLDLLHPDTLLWIGQSLFNQQTLMMIHSFAGNFFTFFLIFHFIASLYQTKISFSRCLLASAIGCLSYQGPIYLVYAFLPIKIFSISLASWLSIFPPYFILILYFCCAYLMKINPHRCLHIVNHCYYLLLGAIFLYLILQAVFFYLFTDSKDYQNFIYFAANSTTYLLELVLYLMMMKKVKSEKLWLHESMKRLDMPIATTIPRWFCKGFIIFLLSVVLNHHARQLTNFLSIFFLLSSLMILVLLINFIDFQSNRLSNSRYDIQNKNLHITSLLDSINEFSGIRHDLNNMMQVYDGYLTVKDYDSLQKYHRNIYNLIVGTGSHLDITRKMSDNPTLYSTLLYKLDKAAQEEVTLRITCTGDASEISIHPLDLSRIVGILLDNAIEEAAKTERKSVHFYTEQKDEKTLLITISNSTCEDIDTKKIFEEHYTTKPDHLGIGLYQLLTYVSKTKSCRLFVEYLNNTITFYLELPLNKETTFSSFHSAYAQFPGFGAFNKNNTKDLPQDYLQSLHP